MELSKILNHSSKAATAPKGASGKATHSAQMNDEFTALLNQLNQSSQAVGASLENTSANPLVAEVDQNLLDSLLNSELGQDSIVMGEDGKAMIKPGQELEVQKLLTEIKADPQMAKKPEGEAIQQLLADSSVQPGSVQNSEAASTNSEVLKLIGENQEGVKPNAGRSPAIDFSKEEVDPKLLNFDDFVAQKNAVTKKIIPQGYGQPQNSQTMIKMNQSPEVLKQTQAAEPVMMNAQAQTQAQTQAQAQAQAQAPEMLAPIAATVATMEPNIISTEAPQKVFDLGKMEASSNDQIIDKIKDYIIQAKQAQEPTANIRVQHQDLGMLDIVVQKMPMDAVQIAIHTQTNDSKLFLNTHQRDLVQSLTQAGIQVSDLKIENSSFMTRSGSESNQQSQFSDQGQAGGHRQFGSENNQRNHDSQRREELWKMMQEKEVA
jgi:flagellar hook-length control protein FliK